MSTLREIAEETGLAIGTVSRILRGKQRVAEETRQRVFEEARRLKYRPNMLIKGIQTGRTQTVGVDMRVGVDGFRATILSGIISELMKVDYVPIVVSGGENEEPFQTQRIHSLVDRRVDGMILYPSFDTEPDEYLREVWDRDIPLTTVDRLMFRTHADFVGTDDVRGGRLAAEHLLTLGHRRFLHIAAPQGVTTIVDRRAGFEEAVAGAGDASLETLVAPEWHGKIEGLRDVLQAADGSTAVFCDTDRLAVSVYAEAHELGLSIPGQLSVVGYADLAIAEVLQPGLTTVRQDAQEIGRRAARQVLDRIDGACVSDKPMRMRLEPEFVVRGSTAAPRTTG